MRQLFLTCDKNGERRRNGLLFKLKDNFIRDLQGSDPTKLRYIETRDYNHTVNMKTKTNSLMDFQAPADLRNNS